MFNYYYTTALFSSKNNNKHIFRKFNLIMTDTAAKALLLLFKIKNNLILANKTL